QTPTQIIRNSLIPDRHAEQPAHHVGCARQCKTKKRKPKVIGESKTDYSQSPHSSGNYYAQAVTMNSRSPARCQSCKKRADRRSRIEESYGSATEIFCQGRKECHRHSEEHSVDVHQICSHQLRATLRITQPFDDGAQARSRRAGWRRNCRHHPERDERNDEGRKVYRISKHWPKL